MIRVPSITLTRPWPMPHVRRPAKVQADTMAQAEHELKRKRLDAEIERERTVAMSSYLDGRPIL
jgi:hypothetical protein